MIGNRAFIALMVGWLLTSAVQAKPRPGDIAGVYPSARPGDRTLYAIARVNPGAGPATMRSGESIIQVFVTGRDRCVEGTASHYFAVPQDVSTRVRLDALEPRGQQTRIHDTVDTMTLDTKIRRQEVQPLGRARRHS